MAQITCCLQSKKILNATDIASGEVSVELSGADKISTTSPDGSYSVTARFDGQNGSIGIEGPVTTFSLDTVVSEQASDLDGSTDTSTGLIPEIGLTGDPVGHIDNFTSADRLKFSGSDGEPGSVIKYYAYATLTSRSSLDTETFFIQGVERNWQKDTGEATKIFADQNANYPTESTPILIAQAVVQEDGTWITGFSGTIDQNGNELPESEYQYLTKTVRGTENFDGALHATGQIRLHVTAKVTDKAGNESDTSDPLQIRLKRNFTIWSRPISLRFRR